MQLAYLFGSQATGQTHADSDVDIAVLLNDGLTVDERFAERLSLIGALSQIFHTDNVDVGRVYDNLQNHLDDFGQFAQYPLDFLAQQPPGIQNDTAVEG